jgi:putative copper export protein
MLAFLRPDEWDFPLFLHVLGALVLFGGVATVVLFAAVARRNPQHDALMRRVSFVTLLAAVWPAYIVMRVGAQWIYDKEDLDPDFPTWMAIGVTVGDGGVVVLLVLTVLGWLALRRKPNLFRFLGGVAALYLVALAVAWWAMSAKPGA